RAGDPAQRVLHRQRDVSQDRDVVGRHVEHGRADAVHDPGSTDPVETHRLPEQLADPQVRDRIDREEPVARVEAQPGSTEIDPDAAAQDRVTAAVEAALALELGGVEVDIATIVDVEAAGELEEADAQVAYVHTARGVRQVERGVLTGGD